MPLFPLLARRLGYEVRKGPPRYEHYLNDARAHDAWLARLHPETVRTVVDVGANDGATARRSRETFPQATVYACEPSPTTFAQLQANVAGDDRIRPVQIALGDIDGSAPFHENVTPAANSLLATSPQVGRYSPAELIAEVRTVTVSVSRLDTFCRTHQIASIDLLKIDAQGNEVRILAGAGDLLSPRYIRAIATEVLFVDLYQGQAWVGEIIELLRKRGYRLYGFGGIAYDEENGWKWGDALFC